MPVDYKAAWRIRTRQWALEYLGAHCVRCGATDELEFDHVIPGSQEFRISEGIVAGYGRQRLLAELLKCQLLCSPCHRVKTAECGEYGGGQNRITSHGSEAVYLRGCRCDPCRLARHDARVERGEITGPQAPKLYPGQGRYGTVTEHGGGTRGIRGCKCDLCRAVRAATMRKYRSG